MLLKRQNTGRSNKKVTETKGKATEKKYNKDELYNFNDLGNYFYESLILDKCQIYSLDSPAQKFLKTLHMTNSLLFSFSYNGAFKIVENLSFAGSPICQYPHYRIMVMLAFGDFKNQHYQQKITKIDDQVVQEEEKNLVKKYSDLSDYVKKGGIIRTFDDSLAEQSIQNILISIPFPENVKEILPSSLSFSPFFTKQSIQVSINRKSDEISKYSITKCIYDYQNKLRESYIELDKFLSNSRLFENETTIYSIIEKIKEMHQNINIYIEKIENSGNKSEILQEGKLFCSISSDILQQFSNIDSQLKKFIQSAIFNYKNLINIINNSAINFYFQEYLNILNQFIQFCEDLLASNNCSIDLLFSSLPKISEFNQELLNCKSPYSKIFDKLFELASELKESYHQNHQYNAAIENLYNSIKFYRISPIFHRFGQILTKTSSIHHDTQVQEIDNLCKAASDENLFRYYKSQVRINDIASYIKHARKSVLLEIFGFWKNHKASCVQPFLLKVDENINKRSEEMRESIHQFNQVIDNTDIVEYYIKDRTYDASLKMKRNELLQNLIKSKKSEIERKDQKIEYLKQLIQNKSKMAS